MLSVYPGLEEKQKQVLISNVYFLITGLSLLVFLVLFFFDEGMQNLLFNRSGIDYYHLFIGFLLFNTPVFLLENFYLLQNRPVRIFYFGMVAFGLQTIVVLLPVFIGLPFVWSFYGLLLLAVIKHIWLLIFVIKNGHFSFDKALSFQLLALSAPLIFYAFLGALNLKFDNWLVTYIYPGDDDLFAVFTYGAREFPLVLTMAAAFGNALLPEIARDTQAGLQMIKSKSLKLLHLLFPLSIVLMLTSEYFYPLVFNPEFAASVPVFNIFLLIVISRLLFSRTVLIGLKDNTVVLYISFMELIVNVALSFIFVRYWGLMGIAAGTVVAFWFEKALISIYLYRKHRIPVGAYVDLRWYLSYSAVLVGCFIIVGVW